MNTSVTGSKGTGGRWRGGARRPSATRMSGRGSAPASSPGLPRLSHGSDSRRRARHGGTALPGFQALPPSSSRRTHHDRHRTLRGAHPAVRPAARRSGLGERAGQLHRRRALSGHPTAARDRCPRLRHHPAARGTAADRRVGAAPRGLPARPGVRTGRRRGTPTARRDPVSATKVDFTRALDTYRARRGEFRVVEVPETAYLMVDGHGDPNTDPSFAAAVAALYPVAYRLKFASKEVGRDYVVPPLEGLWWAQDLAVFTTARDTSRWEWTLMLMVPDWLEDAMVEAAIREVGRTRRPERLDDVRLGTLTEGTCLQTL